LIFAQKTCGSQIEVQEHAVDSCIGCGHCVASCSVDAIGCHDLKAIPFDKRTLPSFASLKASLCSRRSIRNYKPQTLTRGEVKQVLDVAVYAPTGKNTQTIKWAVVLDPVKVKALSGLVIDWMRAMVEQKHPMARMFKFPEMIEGWAQGIDPVLRTAPHLVMAYSHKDDMFGASSAPLNLEYFEIAAHGLGYGTCWAGFFDIAAKSFPPLQQALGLPADHVLQGSLMFGIPDEQYVAFPPRNAPNVTWM
jgi:nitroreductase